MVYLTYRLRNGVRRGPYGMNGREYLGPVTTKEGLVYSKIDGSCLGPLVRRAKTQKKTEPPCLTKPLVIENITIEDAIKRLFYVPGQHGTHQFIDDILDNFPGQEDKAQDILCSLTHADVLREASPGLYWRVA